MFKLICNRWLRWGLLSGVLVALGVGIYHMQQPEPMCVIEAGHVEPRAFADGGTVLVTTPRARFLDKRFSGQPQKMGYVTGPLQRWDTRSGKEIDRHLTENDILSAFNLSPDGGLFAAELMGAEAGAEPRAFIIKSLIVIDLAARRTQEIPFQSASNEAYLFFAANGSRLIHVDSLNDAESLRTFDTSSGRLVDQRGRGRMAGQAGDFLLFHGGAVGLGADLEIWSTRQGKVTATLENVYDPCLDPHGHFVVAEHCTPAGIPAGLWSIWNLHTQKVEAAFRAEIGSVRSTQDISPDGRWLAAFCNCGADHYVEVRALATGRIVGTARLEKTHYWCFSPNGDYLVLEDPDTPALAMFELPSLKMLWRQAGLTFHNWNAFSKDCGTMFAYAKPLNGLGAYDCATGKLRTTVALAGSNPNLNGRLTPDRRSLLAYGGGAHRFVDDWVQELPWLQDWIERTTKDVLVVFDTDACRERFRLNGWNTTTALLSDNGRTLVTVHDEPNDRRILRCWDVNACNPLHWPIGVPAGLATLIVLLAWWRRRRIAKPGNAPSPS